MNTRCNVYNISDFYNTQNTLQISSYIYNINHVNKNHKLQVKFKTVYKILQKSIAHECNIFRTNGKHIITMVNVFTEDDDISSLLFKNDAYITC